MSVTYSWEITSLKTKNEGDNLNAVVQTYWRKIGTDAQGNVGVFEGATPFTSANVPTNEFLPFENLTEEIVLGWIQAVVTGDYAQHVNSRIQRKLDELAMSQPGLPWAPEKGVPHIPTDI